MNDKKKVTSVPEWLELSEPLLPEVKNQDDNGTIYKVKKVGFLFASLAECKEHGLEPTLRQGDQCLLPTAILDWDGVDELCRLPFSLSEWAEMTVAMAHSGMNSLPLKVEFGILNGRPYAEMLF